MHISSKSFKLWYKYKICYKRSIGIAFQKNNPGYAQFQYGYQVAEMGYAEIVLWWDEPKYHFDMWFSYENGGHMSCVQKTW